MNLRIISFLIPTLLFVSLAGCATNTNQSAAFVTSTSQSAQRQLDSRRFDTGDEKQVLSAIVSLLQDLGYSLKETSLNSGLISGTKSNMRVGSNYGKSIEATVSTMPVGNQSVRVRVTFQIITAGKDPRFYKGERVMDPAIYRDFFDKLSQSLFLEAHNI